MSHFSNVFGNKNGHFVCDCDSAARKIFYCTIKGEKRWIVCYVHIIVWIWLTTADPYNLSTILSSHDFFSPLWYCWDIFGSIFLIFPFDLYFFPSQLICFGIYLSFLSVFFAFLRRFLITFTQWQNLLGKARRRITFFQHTTRKTRFYFNFFSSKQKNFNLEITFR